MQVVGIIDEDFVNYKKISMYIAFPFCDFKCDKLNGEKVCQNCALAHSPKINISYENLCKRYLNNPLSEAFVFAGLEPFDSETEMIELIKTIRLKFNCQDDIVIYTGYTEKEIKAKPIYNELKCLNNIIIKYGRFVLNSESIFDKLLGVTLASKNQYAEYIS